MLNWLFERMKPLLIEMLIDMLEQVVAEYKSPKLTQAIDAPGLEDDKQRLKDALLQAVEAAAQKQMNRAIENGAVSFSPPGRHRD